MLIVHQFGIIQNLQTLTIPQTSFMVGTFFCRFLHQDSSNNLAVDLSLYYLSRPRRQSSCPRSFCILINACPCLTVNQGGNFHMEPHP